jgi:hypothetical protein
VLKFLDFLSFTVKSTGKNRAPKMNAMFIFNSRSSSVTNSTSNAFFESDLDDASVGAGYELITNEIYSPITSLEEFNKLIKSIIASFAGGKKEKDDAETVMGLEKKF